MQNATTTSGPLKILLSIDISHLSWGHSAHSSMTVSANLNYCRCSLAPPLCWRAACTGYQLGDLIWQNQVYLQPHLHPKRQLSQLTCLHAPDARQVDNTAAGHRVDAQLSPLWLIPSHTAVELKFRIVSHTSFLNSTSIGFSIEQCW